MNMLESPDLEALAFNYVSFGIYTVVNNLWTWVAVITAAISFWRIRATGATTATSSFSVKPNKQQQPPTDNPNASVSSCHLPVDRCVQPLPASAACFSNILSPRVKDDGVVKGKFTFYYYNDVVARESEGDLATAVNECREDDDDDYSYECEDWLEKAMRVRVGDMEWYRFQDLMVINGNIVRLWDDECRN